MSPWDEPPFGSGARRYPIKFPKIKNRIGLREPRTLDAEGRLLPVQARKIPPKPLSLSGYVALPFMGMVAEFESSLERDSLLLVKESGYRVGLLAQPITIDRRELGIGKGHYTPDLLVWLIDQHGEPIDVTLVEIKPEQDLKKHWSKIRPKLLAGHRFARMQGWRFIVVTERHLRDPLLIAATWSRRSSPKYQVVTSVRYMARLFGDKLRRALR